MLRTILENFSISQVLLNNTLKEAINNLLVFHVSYLRLKKPRITLSDVIISNSRKAKKCIWICFSCGFCMDTTTEKKNGFFNNLQNKIVEI